MRHLEILEPAHLRVVLAVADLGAIVRIVERVVPLDLFAERRDLRGCALRRAGHERAQGKQAAAQKQRPLKGERILFSLPVAPWVTQESHQLWCSSLASTDANARPVRRSCQGEIFRERNFSRAVAR